MDNKKNIVITIGFVFFIIFLAIIYSGVFDFRIPDFRTYTGFMPILIVLAALVDSVNPCAFSILIISIAVLFSLGRTRSNVIKTGLLYILGIFLTYVLIGLGVLKVLNFFNIPHIMSFVGASFIIIFGIIGLLNEFFPNFPIKLKIPKFIHGRVAKLLEKATAPAALGLGFLVGIFEFPCTGGPYLFVLGLLHDQNNFWTGFMYLILYNIIFVLPLIIILVISANKHILQAVDSFRRAETRSLRIWLPLIMILLGSLIFMIN